MIILKRFIHLTLTTLFCVSLLIAQESSRPISFRWALIGKTLIGEKKTIINIQRDTTLYTGDSFKMLVQPLSQSYVYVLFQDSRGAMTLLFPYSSQEIGTAVSTDTSYSMPRGRLWYSLDSNTGRETFYIIASGDRLYALEKLIVGLKKQDEQTAKKITQQVIQQINSYRKQYRKFTSMAEKPIAIAGNVRGIGDEKEVDRVDLSQYATEVEATGIYIRTITIEHR
jgi:hypothetical protein